MPPALAEVRSPEWPGLVVAVVDPVRVSADVIEVRLVFANDGTTPVEVGSRFAADEDESGTLSGIYLTDLAGSTRQFPLRDSDGRPLCSDQWPALGPGERREGWVRFLVPPARWPAVRVHVPHLPPLDAVPVP
jgi:hypothetical protein